MNSVEDDVHKILTVLFVSVMSDDWHYATPSLVRRMEFSSFLMFDNGDGSGRYVFRRTYS
jgi:hypothetical protein